VAIINPRSIFAPASDNTGSTHPLYLFGHRGYSALAPENTLAAFSVLLEHRIPGVELDVQLTRDGRVVVIHDENVKRVTGLDALVQDCPASELRGLDAGVWFDKSFRGERIPLLDEVFELLGDKVYYDVELKWGQHRSGGLEEAVLERIHSHKLEDRCLISSFNPYCIRTTQRLAPDIPTAHIYSKHSSIPLLLRHGEARLAVPTPFMKPRSNQVNLISSFLIRRVFKSEILTWTVDDPQEATHLVHLGVRGLISNHPGKIKAVLPAKDQT
jgi:glycerophosphoryl diester phosphodiesterase